MKGICDCYRNRLLLLQGIQQRSFAMPRPAGNSKPDSSGGRAKRSDCNTPKAKEDVVKLCWLFL